MKRNQNKSKHLIEVKNRMPDGILVDDETCFEWTDDEYVAILSWIKCFKNHNKILDNTKNTFISVAVISKRLYVDFSFYNLEQLSDDNRKENIIYIRQNGQLINGTFLNNMSADTVIKTHKL